MLVHAAARDRRRRHAEPRDDRRQHRERVAGGRHAARAPRLRRRARTAVVGGRRAAFRTARFTPATRRWTFAPGEIISRVIRCRGGSGGWRDFYRKVGTRRAQAISKVCYGGVDRRWTHASLAHVRVALGSVAPIVLRATPPKARCAAGRSTSGSIAAAQQALARDIAPIDDIRSTARYRRRVAQNLLGEFLQGSSCSIVIRH